MKEPRESCSNHNKISLQTDRYIENKSLRRLFLFINYCWSLVEVEHGIKSSDEDSEIHGD